MLFFFMYFGWVKIILQICGGKVLGGVWFDWWDNGWGGFVV